MIDLSLKIVKFWPNLYISLQYIYKMDQDFFYIEYHFV